MVGGKRRSGGTLGLLACVLLIGGLSAAEAAPPPGYSETKLIASDGALEDQFGRSVAVAGDKIIVGVENDDDNGTSSGSAYVYTPDGTGGYTEAKLIASDNAAGDRFGRAVAASGDTILVGSPGSSSNGNAGDSGAVYFYTPDGLGSYTESKLTPSDGTFNGFGSSLAVDGETIVVSGGGSVYVYTPDGLGGYSETKLTASDGASAAGFGVSVAADGGRIVVGAFHGDATPTTPYVGSAYLYTPDGVGGYTETKLIASDGSLEDEYGAAVAIAGDTILIGAPYDDDSRWYPGEPDNLGYNVGSVYVYSPDGIGGYTETKFASSDAPVFQRFGGSIAILGDEIIIGATGDDRNGWETGAVYLYSPDGLGGYTETKITTADGASSHNYGSVAAAGNTIVIGALGADGVVPYSGAVYVYSPEPPGEAMTILDTPCPVYDSNTATGLGLSGPLAGNETRTVSVTGAVPTGQGVGTAECVPDGATAAVFTISVVDPQGSGNLRLSPAGVVPNGGVVNYAANSLNNANTVTVPLGASGQADIFANVAGTDVRLVTLGYTSGTTGLRYNSVTPCAVADSRPNQGPTGAFVGPFGPGAAYPDVDVVGTFPDAQGGGNTTCNIPAGADAVVVNLVAVGTTGGTGFLSAATAGLDPFEPATPFAPVGMNNSATTIIPLQDGEKITVDIDALTGTPSTHVRAVIVGYLDNTGDSFIPRTGCAAFDTRPGFGGSGTFVGKRAAGTSTTYQITGAIPAAQGGGHSGSCGVPAGAKSVLINLVAVQPDNDGNFRAYATGTTPTGGVVNYAPLTPPMNNANAVVIPLSTAGQLDLFVNTHTNDGTPSTHARGVILGYYK